MRMLAEISIQKASARPISASDSTDVPILAGPFLHRRLRTLSDITLITLRPRLLLRGIGRVAMFRIESASD